jgi:IS5 family transposase
MEFYLNTNLLFMSFCRFSISESKPDHSTDLPLAEPLCRIRDV